MASITPNFQGDNPPAVQTIADPGCTFTLGTLGRLASIQVG
jgi:hypothetical protein